MIRPRALFIGICCFVLPLAAPGLGDSLASGPGGEPIPLQNGDFREWEGGRPGGWEVIVGARSRDQGPESRLEPLEEGGIALRGRAETAVWRALVQSFPVKEGESLLLRYEGRVVDPRHEAGQFHSRYVGFHFQNEGGERLGLKVSDVISQHWRETSLFAVAPPGTAKAQVMIFLAQTGSLELRSVSLERTDPSSSFDILVRDMGRHYPQFPLRRIRWEQLSGAYRSRAESARTPEEFIDVIRRMLARLEDLHIWITDPEGKVHPTHVEKVPRNYDIRSVAASLRNPRQIGRAGLVGRTSQGFGYVALGSFQGSDDAPFRELEKAIAEMADAPALILDLRANGGGQELRARRLASIFCDEERTYARSLVRSGPAPGDLAEGEPRRLAPHPEIRYLKPVACLIGRGCVSSGEAFVLMMKALPHVTLLGQPTRGASGNPHPVELPNGVTVHYSRWLSLLPDGQPYERKGIAPDVPLRHRGDGDPTFRLAVEWLEKKVRPPSSD